MEELSEQDRQTGDAARPRRKRVAERTIRVLGLVVGFLWLLIFLTVLRTGYLSSTGIALGAVLVMTYLVAPVVGLAGKKRLEKLLSWLWVGTIILFVLVAIMAYLWPGGGGTWHPYRFDDELAAIEAKRAVPDAENAALRYEAVLAGMDLDDEPDFVFSGSSLRDEPGQHPWRAKEYPLASAWLDSQSATIGRLLEIGRMEKCRWPVQADTYDEYTVPYKKLRRSMLLLVAVGNRDLGEDRVTDALTKYFRALRIADHIHQQPSMVDCLTSFACERDGLRMIRYALVQSNLSDENIAEIAKHLPPAADPWLEEWERLLEHEKLHYMNLLGRLYEVNADGAVRFAAQPLISAKGKDGKRTSRFPRLYWLISMPRDPHADPRVRVTSQPLEDLHRRGGVPCDPLADLRVRVAGQAVENLRRSSGVSRDPLADPRDRVAGQAPEELRRRGGVPCDLSADLRVLVAGQALEDLQRRGGVLRDPSADPHVRVTGQPLKERRSRRGVLHDPFPPLDP